MSLAFLELESTMFIKQALFQHTSISTVEHSLDASALRSKAIADNLANVMTPGYKRIEVSFEKELRRALDPNQVRGSRTDSRHIPVGSPMPLAVTPKGGRPDDIAMAGGINNVDIDLEASKMAENTILFRYGVRFITERRGAIEAAIGERPQG